MAKARHRKETSFESKPLKSVFLYGYPNTGKLDLLRNMESVYLRMVNDYIQLLDRTPGIMLQLVKNDKKDSFMRSLEKELRPSGLNSAFCQNAFDSAVTALSNRLDSVRIEMLRQNHKNIFVLSKVLFAMSIENRSVQEMAQAMQTIAASTKKDPSFYAECAARLSGLSEEEFSFSMKEFHVDFVTASSQFRIPCLKSVSVPLDSRLMRIEPSDSTVSTHVISITNPFKKKDRISIPINTSRHSLNKIRSSHMAGTVLMSTRNGTLRIAWSYKRKYNCPDTVKTVGVDTGILDAFALSTGETIGSMRMVIDNYQNIVEPAFGQLSKLRNKKSRIRHYMKKHSLPEDVRRSLIRKMDRLDHMISTAESPYRKQRHYSALLDQEISAAVKTYVKNVSRDTLTVVEQLDLKEFQKSRHLNGQFSTFARGKLHLKLLGELNWHGFDFAEVVPDYTSQLCPVCSNVDPENRSGKVFLCTCCGHKADADVNAAVNISARFQDTEIQEVCTEFKYRHKAMQKHLKEVYASRNETFRKTTTPSPESVCRQ